MTREEAEPILKDMLRGEVMPVYLPGRKRDAVRLALSALRPVSREQVEKMWRGKWQRGTKDWVCSRCGRSHTFVKSFCPNCGAPMTDEAVQMVLERLEALHEVAE